MTIEQSVRCWVEFDSILTDLLTPYVNDAPKDKVDYRVLLCFMKGNLPFVINKVIKKVFGFATAEDICHVANMCTMIQFKNCYRKLAKGGF